MKPSDVVAASFKPMSVAGRIGGSIFFSIFAAFGIVFIGLMIHQIGKDHSAGGWTPAPCKILKSTYQLPQKNSQDYRYIVRYRYTAGGKQHTSEQFAVDYKGSENFEPVQRAMIEFPEKSDRTCYVNPADPAQSVLQTISGDQMLYWFIPLPLLFVIIGVGGVVAMWMNFTKSNTEALSKSVMSFNRRRRGWLIGCGLLALIGLAITIKWCVPLLLRASQSNSWPAVQATVIYSNVDTHSSDDGDTYSINILSRYGYNGRQYFSNRYDLMGGSSSGRDTKQSIVRSLPPGSHATLYVNPNDPVIAVMERGFDPVMLVCLIPILMIGLGAFGFVKWLFRSPDSMAPTFTGVIYQSPSSSRPVQFNSRGARIKNFLGALFAAVFWNGIVSIFFLVGAHNGFPKLLYAFLGIFVIAGLFIVFMAIKAFLAVFSPAIHLSFSQNPMRLGETVTAKWSFSGRYDRISHLTIALEGREQVWYHNSGSKGDSIRTETFATLNLVDTTRPTEIADSQVSFKIPPTTMHSFKAKNNKILWFIIVKGEIANWPDIKDEIPIEILPLQT